MGVNLCVCGRIRLGEIGGLFFGVVLRRFGGGKNCWRDAYYLATERPRCRFKRAQIKMDARNSLAIEFGMIFRKPMTALEPVFTVRPPAERRDCACTKTCPSRKPRRVRSTVDQLRFRAAAGQAIPAIETVKAGDAQRVCVAMALLFPRFQLLIARKHHALC